MRLPTVVSSLIAFELARYGRCLSLGDRVPRRYRRALAEHLIFAAGAFAR
jgi:hypothetical protein